jgi:hypothetical protein
MFHIAILSIVILLFTWLRYVTNNELKANGLVTITSQTYCAELCITLSISNYSFFLSKIKNSKMLVRLLPDWCIVQWRTQSLYSWSAGRDDIFITCVERRRINTEEESTWNSLFNFPKGNQALAIYYADLNTFVMLPQGKSNKICCFMWYTESNEVAAVWSTSDWVIKTCVLQHIIAVSLFTYTTSGSMIQPELITLPWFQTSLSVRNLIYEIKNYSIYSPPSPNDYILWNWSGRIGSD